jgi:hypothetical protein
MQRLGDNSKLPVSASTKSRASTIQASTVEAALEIERYARGDPSYHDDSSRDAIYLQVSLKRGFKKNARNELNAV